MKLTALTKLANHPNYGGISIGNKLHFVPDKALTNTNDLFPSYTAKWVDNGELEVEKSIFTFCYSDFARLFKTRTAAIKVIFAKNTLYNVRITIEILEEEEWEYTK